MAFAGCGDSKLPWESVASLSGEKCEDSFEDAVGCLLETMPAGWLLGSVRCELPLKWGSPAPMDSQQQQQRSCWVQSKGWGSGICPLPCKILTWLLPYLEAQSCSLPHAGRLVDSAPGSCCFLRRLAGEEGWKVCKRLHGKGTAQNIQGF